MTLAIDGFGLTLSPCGFLTYFYNILGAIKNNQLIEQKDIHIQIFMPDNDCLVEPIQKKHSSEELKVLENQHIVIHRIPYPFYLRLLFKVLSGPLLFLLPDKIEDLYKIYLFIWLKIVLPKELRKSKDTFEAIVFLEQYVIHPKMPIKVITVVHDVMTWYQYRGQEKQNRIKSFVYFYFLKELRKCDLIIALSLNTKTDLIVEFGLPPEKIQIIYESIAPAYQEFFEKRTHSNLIESIQRKSTEIKTFYQLSKPYVLVNNPFNERKNSIAIMHAADILADKGIDIVFIGDAKRNREKRIKQKVLSQIKYRDRDNIKFIQIRATEDFPYLYYNSSFFCTFSLKEGFGLPPLEALSCGTLVLLSELSTHLELLKNYPVFYVNPFSSQKIRSVIERIIKISEQERKHIIRVNDTKLKEFFTNFSWQNISTEFILAIEYTLQEKKPREDFC